MKVWLYSDDYCTYVACLLADDACRVHKIALCNTQGDVHRIGAWFDEVCQGLPGYPGVKDYYETAQGHLTSAMGRVWEIDRTMRRVGIIFVER